MHIDPPRIVGAGHDHLRLCLNAAAAAAQGIVAVDRPAQRRREFITATRRRRPPADEGIVGAEEDMAVRQKAIVAASAGTLLALAVSHRAFSARTSTPLGLRSLAALLPLTVSIIRPDRNGIAPPPCEKMNFMSGFFASVPVKTRLVMVRGVERELDRLRDEAGDDGGAARRHGGVDIDDRLAAIEFGEHRRERGIAEYLPS